MGSSRVNIGNAAPSRKKVKKPKKMRGGGSVGDPLKMKDGGGLQDMSGDGKITQRDRIMAARGEKPIKKAMGGLAKKSGVIKKMRGGPVNK